MREETVKLHHRAARLLIVCALSLCFAPPARTQGAGARGEREFGPVVSAYLGYLNAEQEVTDARESRREVSAAYVRRNSNRIDALRRMAIQIARTSHNDYVPELYAVARDELGTLFETPPSPATFRVGEVLNNTFRFLGTVRANEPFYLFARLDIYEQAELIKKAEAQRAGASNPQPAGTKAQGEAATRPRRVSPP
ncbi:MAG: hypothetical protein LC785_12925 [Acidobacteria bacterium]|nr:hypothetical protein [Acidobacteriota bacterium]MCA1642819.1 hypothetical protein [Acidobacteriota bacterium]